MSPNPMHPKLWAPPTLVEQHERLWTAFCGLPIPEFHNHYLIVLETLCCHDEMESAWHEISRHAQRHDYHQELAERITKSILRKPTCTELSAEQLREKKKQAASAAKKLKGLLNQMGFQDMSVFPILGTKAMSGAIYHFIDGTPTKKPLPVESTEWADALDFLGGVMMKNHPGVGTIESLLSRLEQRLESDDERLWPRHRSGTTDARVKHLCLSTGQFTKELCGMPLYGSVARICNIFFEESMDAQRARKVLNAAGVSGAEAP